MMNSTSDHHDPSELSERIYQCMFHSEVEAYFIAVKLEITTQEVVSEVMRDRRMAHKFTSKQEYNIILTRYG